MSGGGAEEKPNVGDGPLHSGERTCRKERQHMKRKYETPGVELVKFQYSDQVVAQSGGCQAVWRFYPDGSGAGCAKPEIEKWLN